MKNVMMFNEDGSISLHYDNLNPTEIESLISILQGNLWAMKQKAENPIEVLQKSVRLNRILGEISFRLSWSAPEITFDPELELPDPNISLSEEQTNQYYHILNKMVAAI